MVEFNRKGFTGHKLSFYSDASANPNLCFRAVYNDYWLYGQWELGYIRKYNPSIEYLELFALTAALLTWGDLLRNMQIIIFCDNEAVVRMVNLQTSSCKNCMSPVQEVLETSTRNDALMSFNDFPAGLASVTYLATI